MPQPLDKSTLLAALSARASALGLVVRQDPDDGTLRGKKVAIKARWLLGGNRSTYSFSCRLDEGEHTATFRESVLDTSWGIAPPGFKIEATLQKGTTVTSTREERVAGGGGTLKFGEWREECAAAVSQAGWRFKHEALRAP
jgi:hypothetical protein